MAAAAPRPSLSHECRAPYDPECLRALSTACAGYEREMVLELLLRVPWLMQEIDRAVILRDPERLALLAHDLQRCCVLLGAEPLGDASTALEHMGERADFRIARTLLECAHAERTRLEQALAAHLAELRGR